MNWPVFVNAEQLISRIWAAGDVIKGDDHQTYVENLRVFLGSSEITWSLTDSERALAREHVLRQHINAELDDEKETRQKISKEIDC